MVDDANTLEALDRTLFEADAGGAPAIAARAYLLAAKAALEAGAGQACHRLLAQAQREQARLAPADEVGARATRFDVELWLTLAEQAFIEGRLEDATREGERAVAIAEKRLRDAPLTGRALLILARTAATGAEFERAATTFERAAAAFEAAQLPRWQANVALSYGFSLLDAERSEDADEVFQTAKTLAGSIDDAILEARALGYLGNTARYRARYAVADALYAQARARLENIEDPTWTAVFNMDAGLCALCRGEPRLATTYFDAAIAGFAARRTHKLARLTGAANALALAQLRANEQGDDAHARPAHWAAIEENPRPQDPTLERNCALYRQAASIVVTGHLPKLPAPPEHSNQHDIIARRILDAIVAEQRRTRPHWKIIGDGAAVVSPTQERLDLSRWPLLGRLAIALATAHADAPGRALSTTELFAAGWPDEGAQEDAIKNRVRVAVSTLRRHGLRELIESEDGGYRFAPSAIVTRASATTTN